MSSDPLPAPSGVRTYAAALVRAIAGGGGRLLVGGIFALTLVVLAGRTRGAPAAPITAPAPLLQAPPLVSRALDLPPRGDPAPGDGDVLALEALLASYDALIRLAEERAITTRTPSADQVLRTLRRLRAETYETARQAIPSQSDRSEPDRFQ